jgi:hypothetical protein
MKNMQERRNSQRLKFNFYMAVADDETDAQLGHLTNISDFGLRLDCTAPQPVEKDFHLRIELTSDLGGKAFMVLVARSKWCHEDKLMPNVYNVGFQVMDLAPEDVEIYNRIQEKYGKKE